MPLSGDMIRIVEIICDSRTRSMSGEEESEGYGRGF
jgi:hypothetical protein